MLMHIKETHGKHSVRVPCRCGSGIVNRDPEACPVLSRAAQMVLASLLIGNPVVFLCISEDTNAKFPVTICCAY